MIDFILRFIPRFIFQIDKRHLFSIVLYLLILIFFTAIAFFYLEKDKNPQVHNLYDGFWWTIVTFTTVGYGDISPQTQGGRILAIVAMILGIGFIGAFIGSLTATFFQERGKELRGMAKIQMKKHLVLCGYHPYKINTFLKEFRSDSTHKKVPIVLVTNQLEEHPMEEERNVHFVRGEIDHEPTLVQAGIHTARWVVILLEEEKSYLEDKQILTALMIQELNPFIHCTVELLSEEKKKLLIKRYPSCEVVIASQISARLLVQSVQDPGIVSLLSELLTNTRGHEFYRAPLETEFWKKSFLELIESSLKNDKMVIAIHRKNEIIVKPKLNFLLEEGDFYFFISEERRPNQ